MVKVTLKGGAVKEYDDNVTVAEIAKSLGGGLYKAACAGKLNGRVVDLRTPITEDSEVELLTFDSQEGKRAYWHTTSHIMAQAVGRLFPDAVFAIGPSIDQGFYYDFDLPRNLTPDDLTAIESEMKKIIKEDEPLERFELEPEEAVKLMEEKGQPYKVELIQEHSGKGEKISFYRQGDFTDLCAGPHLMSTKPIGGETPRARCSKECMGFPSPRPASLPLTWRLWRKPKNATIISWAGSLVILPPVISSARAFRSCCLTAPE